MGRKGKTEQEIEEAFEAAWKDARTPMAAAVDEITNIFGLAEEGDLIRFLRSDEPITRYFRDTVADALEKGTLRIVRQRGKPRSILEKLIFGARQFEIAIAVSNRANEGHALKAAVTDVAQEFSVSERTVRAAMRFFQDAKARVSEDEA